MSSKKTNSKKDHWLKKPLVKRLAILKNCHYGQQSTCTCWNQFVQYDWLVKSSNVTMWSFKINFASKKNYDL
jgi:hypothetical protein